MADQWRVTADIVKIRNGPSMNNEDQGYVYKGDILTVYETNGIWIRHGLSKWSATQDPATGSYIMARVSDKDPVDTTDKNSIKNTAGAENEFGERGSGFLPNAASIAAGYSMYTELPVDDRDNLTIRNPMAILGLPYQFLENVDAPLLEDDKAALGRKYAEKIVSRAPLLLLSPGEARFLTAYGNKDKETVLEALLGVNGADTTSISNFIQSNNGRYYTFVDNYNDYYNYVNPMCRIAARYLGIQGELLDGTPLDRVDWMQFTTKRLQSFSDIGLAGAVPFYVDSETSISESFSNSTGQSMLEGIVNPASDQAREINFLMGYGSNALGKDLSLFETKEIDQYIQESTISDNIISNLINKSSLLSNLKNNIITVASGGKLIFPEIWNDSSFARSYNINIKFTTPDCDVLSWYFNICVPILHLVALVAPRGIASNASGYINPFLVRGYYKGFFNCDTGIITDMSINKGAPGAWTKEGLPTVVEVSFTIKDLYDVMSISSGASGGIFSVDAIKNTALMDYIANFCGINIHKMEIERQIDIWFTQSVTNRITDAVTKNIWGGIEQNIQNSIMNIYNRSFR